MYGKRLADCYIIKCCLGHGCLDIIRKALWRDSGGSTFDDVAISIYQECLPIPLDVARLDGGVEQYTRIES